MAHLFGAFFTCNVSWAGLSGASISIIPYSSVSLLDFYLERGNKDVKNSVVSPSGNEGGAGERDSHWRMRGSRFCQNKNLLLVSRGKGCVHWVYDKGQEEDEREKGRERQRKRKKWRRHI